MRALERGQHLRARARARSREQRDLVAALGQLRGEQRHHLFDPAVSGRRDLDPWRCQHCDLHRDSFPSRRCVPGSAQGMLVRMGSPLGAAGQPRRHDRDQGRQRLPGRAARRPPAGRRRPPARTLVPGLPLPLRARAAHLRPACRACSRPPTPRAPQAVHELTNPDLELSDGRRVPGRVAATARGADGSTPRARCASASRCGAITGDPIQLPLELRLGADFQPMLELRGIVPKHERPPPDAGPDGFSLVGRDGVRRATRFARRPSRASSTTARSCSTSTSRRAARSTWWWTSRSRRATDGEVWTRRAAQAPRGGHAS